MRAVLVFFVAALALPLITAADVVAPIESVQYFVNVRAEPDADADIIARLYRGDSMALVNSLDGWHEVRIEEGLNGFISAEWTIVLTDAGAPVSDAIPLPEAGDESAAPEPEIIEQAGGIEAADPAPKPQQPQAAQGAVARPPRDDVEQPPEMTTDLADGAEAALPPPVATPPPLAAPAPMEPSAPFGAPDPVQPPGDKLPPVSPGAATLEGSVNFLAKFTEPTAGGSSLVYDDGRNIGIGTTEPKQRLEVNGNIQIHEKNSSVAGLMITQSSGETGYIMHNRGSTLTIGAGSVDRITIDGTGNVGIGESRPAHPLEMANGAHVTAGGVWTNSSSRRNKENVVALTSGEALQVLQDLEPVRFNYRADTHDEYVGFIAEDVPELVASKDRKGLSAMDIVAVLTKVVQAQQERIEELEARLGD